MFDAAFLAYAGSASAGALAGAAAWRARKSFSRWAFAAGMLVLAAECLFMALLLRSSDSARADEWNGARLFVLSFVPLPWLAFTTTFAHASPRRALRRHRTLLIAAALLPLVALLLPHSPATELDYLGHGRHLGLRPLILHAAVLLASVLIVMNLERTFRASIGTVRWQIKYMLLGVGVIFAARVYTTSQVLLYRGTFAGLDYLVPGSLIAAAPLLVRALLRAGDRDVDVYPSGPALRNTLTVLIAGVYLVIVGTFAKVVTFFGGDAAFGLKALVVLIALVLLAVALQSDRARLYVRRFVSHHFQRPLHDYSAVWRHFTEATTTCIEEAALCQSVAKLVSDVFQSLSVRIWILNDRRDTLTVTASTSARVTAADEVQLDARELVAHFEREPLPLDVDARRERWVAALREGHPTEFPHGGHRVAVPLVAHGEMLGMLTLGDRVSAAPFGTQDLELLKCIADHTAASLLNVHLSQRLLQGKQLEAFQSMAAFFVHDLKNAASTLNLMLRNLPVHFDDPEFRADALRGIGKTVEHINGLIGRLTALRHELKVDPVACDLNEVVAGALASLRTGARASIVEALQPVPSLLLDSDQIQKVVTNLVLNAAEATGDGGTVRVSTHEERGWAVLTVEDDGCGMTEEFVARSLFRPFQTTKKNGLGIGMFQSKMIVEAHGGRIAVASRPGEGTRFQVFLRATSTAARSGAAARTFATSLPA